MRKLHPLTVLAAVLLVGCTAPVNRSLERYYDPSGLFSSELPDANEVQVLAAGGEFGPGVQMLGGVASQPVQRQQTGRFNLGGQTDQAVFQIFALASETFASSDDVAGLLTADTALTLESNEPFVFADGDGVLLVGAYEADQGAIGVAAGFLLFEGVGYMVLEVFPPGTWTAQRDDFRQILRSFRAQTPPGLSTVPVGSA